VNVVNGVSAETARLCLTALGVVARQASPRRNGLPVPRAWLAAIHELENVIRSGDDVVSTVQVGQPAVSGNGHEMGPVPASVSEWLSVAETARRLSVFGVGRVPFYASLWETDPQGTERLITNLAACRRLRRRVRARAPMRSLTRTGSATSRTCSRRARGRSRRSAGGGRTPTRPRPRPAGCPMPSMWRCSRTSSETWGQSHRRGSIALPRRGSRSQAGRRPVSLGTVAGFPFLAPEAGCRGMAAGPVVLIGQPGRRHVEDLGIKARGQQERWALCRRGRGLSR
jgi:hypothetical protein